VYEKVAQPIYWQTLCIHFTVEKTKPKMLATSVFLPKVNNRPFGKKLAHSRHPVHYSHYVSEDFEVEGSNATDLAGVNPTIMD
jgi:hypothetical protein